MSAAQIKQSIEHLGKAPEIDAHIRANFPELRRSYAFVLERFAGVLG